ncbi:fructokinase [Agromyces flavus]|uniref:Fructokinase n=1 Tax=Agromyces flavus TaxID=589382 RepID=A0A1H2A0K7_9MICO|nr:carbohydrate kinase [Agromyces flavus]MCP2367374.1 fructokinase [Agromyces flavus]GGI45854.1 ribokinase [Agromyces flavus]SDT39581.1 fructokinase [Agromyces flavus]
MPERSGALVIGEALMDLVDDGTSITRSPGGSPANVALGLARLGVETRLRTALGPDDDGRAILERLEGSGVGVDPESLSLERTSTALAVLDASGAAMYDFDIEWRLPSPVAADSAAVVHSGSIALFLEPGASVVADALASRPADVLVSLDPNIRPALLGERSEVRATFESLAATADLVKLSDEDAEWLYPGEPLGDVLDRLLDLGVALAAATRGGDGAILATRAARVEVESLPVQVRDTVGAGDTFMAALIAGVLQLDGRAALAELGEADLLRLGRFAATAAGVTVSRVGADLPTADEVARAQQAAAVDRGTTGAAGTVVW